MMKTLLLATMTFMSSDIILSNYMSATYVVLFVKQLHEIQLCCALGAVF